MELSELLALPPSGDPAGDAVSLLRAAGRDDTLAHCRTVAAQAEKLALRFGHDAPRARLAAICHDLAAVVPQSRALAVARQLGVKPDPIQQAAPVLLHGPIAAAFLRRQWGVRDDDLLNAIHYHSTGRAGASPLELILFVADKIALDPHSPVRDFVPAVRRAAERSLEQAALIYLEWVMRAGLGLGWMIHPDAQAAYAALR